MRAHAFALAALALLPAAAGASGFASVKLDLRGREQSLRLYGTRGGPAAVVASGDGGWIHLGPYVAEFLSGQGYFVVGFDSRAYLSSFTSKSSTLSALDVPQDFAALVDYAARGAPERPLLIGVSEGAALAVLAATDGAVKDRVLGVIGLGLPERAELGWRLRDAIIYLTKRDPNEPSFSTAEVIGRLAPLPLVAIHSSRDEYVPLDEVQRVMARAAEPKQLWVVAARNHRFAGNEQEFGRKLLAAAEWIRQQRR